MSLLTGKNYIVIPKATTVERLALTAVDGMVVYDTTLNAFYRYENGVWGAFAGGGLQPGDNVSELVNDAGYVTDSDLTTALDTKQTIPFAQSVNTTSNLVATSATTIYSKSLTGLAVGDVVQLRLVGNLINNSGSARTYTHFISFGSLTLTILDGLTIATSATNESVHEIEATICISATDLTTLFGELDRGVPGAIDTAQSIAVTTVRKAFNESTSDLTGTQTISYSAQSNSSAAGQTFKLRAVIVTILKSNP